MELLERILDMPFDEPNAAPEWQARSLVGRSRELVVACPLEGLVRRPVCMITEKLAIQNKNNCAIEQYLQAHATELSAFYVCCMHTNSGKSNLMAYGDS